MSEIRLDDKVIVVKQNNLRYDGKPPIGKTGIVIRVEKVYCCLDTVPGGVYKDEIELYTPDWED